ncbi:TPA: aminoacyl-tRNA hydrolase [candidate division CPR2 bacterium]|uniref:Peptidyl-tRNA hydrolase n=1 Tax=candidate division CPR2 bacterium GW2011_GWC1_41_48 TaxID=1618344 RepID=A0A0G0YJX2_UNCC2|nr:MAG: Peptidyl-tRNA hydrolase [candidate division CPR2 bacterium GW2011_GWC2_39_35]KKR28010.1 MAG: Peptidyl-tRNA hydrolase [candidate division CPR2 bacterium GW2011_GWD2_39_7]KKR28412.1 MAG: Peptidyl-tRNA hydrolase [candidate division CPR2 bacterium GW2011_GWD1_39_7]KKS09841.1 MAG: Peptidyl-tRNA hydrolase [candidate division CPR2 bacterium GW2011_GWC1_41_48]OGB60672.1 MAG: aminoacyl-tRNA hydrolase [candidate division CPR2 bacterium GWD1_39_7]OGB72104.1 MAG: aminoacyl-tRNA hydrolase [candidat
MIVLVGLGNPGRKYVNTRHNVGFQFLDYLAREERTDFVLNKYFNAEIARTTIKDQDIFMVKPQSFMNLSGASVQGVISYFHVPVDKVWVIYDDVDLDLETIRVRKEGSSGGHKGLQSIIDCLGSAAIPRFRIGVKTKALEKIPTEKYVLQKFSPEEQRTIDKVLEKTRELILKALKEGIADVSK